MADITDLVARYEELTIEKRRLEASLRQVQEHLDELEPELVEAMTQSGLQSLSTPRSTVYLAEEIWASAEDPDGLLAALDDDTGWAVAPRRVNVQRLSAMVREILSTQQEEPEWMRHVKISRRFRARLRSK